MTIAQTNESTPRKPLRLWPGVVAAVLLLAAGVVPIANPEWVIFGLLGEVVCGLVIVVWWLFFSRALWAERVGAILFGIVVLFATRQIVHPSISNAGMGNLMPILGIPVVSLGLVAAVIASRRLSTGPRRISIAAGILLASGAFAVVRTGGVSGNGVSDLHWRWTPTHEDRLLAATRSEPLEFARSESKPKASPPADGAIASEPKPGAAPPPPPTDTSARRAPLDGARSEPLDSARGKPAKDAVDPAAVNTVAESAGVGDRGVARVEWPGFRGPNRDDIIRGVRIKTDWSASPPVEMWRRPIGPGWSSFAVQGDVLYTQEQRGEDEIVAAYTVSGGEPVWRHSDPVRFWESNGGAGPRATPTLGRGRVYTHGATGILNALDARDGKVAWSRSVASDTHKSVPMWGFASSPLLVDDVVIVAATGTLAAYDVATGKPRWFGPTRRGGYSSPHLATIDGVVQILLLTADGVLSVAPADGKPLWEHAWPGVPIIQPATMLDRDVLITTGDMMGGLGVRRVAVAHGAGGWTAEERWTSSGLKPYFNDFVVHRGHAFGFDGGILACIDLEDGKRKWKGGRYGHGQLVLLADQDVLLVLSEEGEVALVSATPDRFTELAKAPALEGKTWNHPALVGDILLVRNDHEMAAFRLSLAGR